MEYLERLNISDRATHMPNELSGGQKQRVAIARSLVCKPNIILADEPTGQLDSKTSNDVVQILKEVNQEGKTVIIVTHETSVAQITNKIIYLKDGCISSEKYDKL